MIATHQDNVDTDGTFDGVCAWKVREHGFRQLWDICDLVRYWINAKGSLWKNQLDFRLPEYVSMGDKKQQIKGKETLVAKLWAVEKESPYGLEIKVAEFWVRYVSIDLLSSSVASVTVMAWNYKFPYALLC